MDSAPVSFSIEILAFKNKTDFIFADNFQIGVKRVKEFQFLKLFFGLYYISYMPDINLFAAFPAAKTVTGSVISPL